MPDLTGQPAVAKAARPPQFQFAQSDLQAVGGIRGDLAILGEQTQRARALLLFIEDLQGLAPGRLLAVVDLAQVKDGALRGLAGRQTTVLHHAEVAVILAVLPAVGGAQKHQNSRMPEEAPQGKRIGLHHNGSRPAALCSQQLGAARYPKMVRNCESQFSLIIPPPRYGPIAIQL